jgi:hypothetical protein
MIRVGGEGHRYKFTAYENQNIDETNFKCLFAIKKGQMAGTEPAAHGRGGLVPGGSVLKDESPLNAAKDINIRFLIPDQQQRPLQLEIVGIKVAGSGPK